MSRYPRLFANINKSYKERPSEGEPFKRRIYIAFEGLETEPEYFKFLKHARTENSKNVIDIITLDREKHDGKSHPNHVRDGIIEYYNANIDFIDKNDSLWIVFDIDEHFGGKKEVDPSKYHNFLTTLDGTKNSIKKQINAAISMPSFELWLILHHKKVNELDFAKLKSNRKSPKSKSYIKKYFAEIDQNIYANDSFFMESVKRALEGVKHKNIEKNIENLYFNVGTSVHKLLEDILEPEN